VESGCDGVFEVGDLLLEGRARGELARRRRREGLVLDVCMYPRIEDFLRFIVGVSVIVRTVQEEGEADALRHRGRGKGEREGGAREGRKERQSRACLAFSCREVSRLTLIRYG